MKRAIIICVLFICIASTGAQDIVHFGDSVYMFNSPQSTQSYTYNGTELQISQFVTFGLGCDMHERISQAYYADRQTWIYGVAVTLFHPISQYADHYTDYAEEIQKLIDSAIAVNGCNATTLHTYNSETKAITLQRKEYFQYPAKIRRFIYSITTPSSAVVYDTVRSVELYFDRQIPVTDTFFVGLQLYPICTIADTTNPCCFTRIPKPYDPTITEWTGLHPYGNCTVDTAKKNKWIYFPDANDDNLYERHPYIYESSPYYPSFYPWGLVFPILYPREDGCTAPGRPWVVERGETWVTLEWDTLDGPAELAFGTNYNGNPDTMAGIVSLAAGSTGHTIANLQPGTTYGAWLRRECHWVTPTYDTTVWSPWSPICLISTAGTSGIGDSDEVPFTLSPNPAQSTFNIRTDYLPATLTLYDPQGRTVYTTIIRSHNTAIGIGDLTRGVYHVSLSTTDGRTSTRRLVVE